MHGAGLKTRVASLYLMGLGIAALCLGVVGMLTAPTAPRYDGACWVYAAGVAALTIGWALKCMAAIIKNWRDESSTPT